MYLLGLAQKRMKVAGSKILAVDVLMKKDVLGRRHKRITVESRATNQVEQLCGGKGLAFGSSSSPNGWTLNEKST